MLKTSSPFLFIIATIVGILWLAHLPPKLTLVISREGGLIEKATAVFLWLGALLCLWRSCSRREDGNLWLELTALLITMAARESDPHRLLPGFNFLKQSFYYDPRIPVFLRLFYGMFLLMLAGLLAHLAFRLFFLFRNSFRKKMDWTTTALAFLTAEVIAATPHKWWGAFLKLLMPVPRNILGFFATIFEEPLELAGSILLVITILQIPPLKKINGKKIA